MGVGDRVYWSRDVAAGESITIHGTNPVEVYSLTQEEKKQLGVPAPYISLNPRTELFVLCKR
jgi:hypothetical protein